jgi:predicted nucleic acid-binding protein
LASQVIAPGRNPRRFFDTNILVYSDDPRYPAKQQKALDLIEEHKSGQIGVISLQVLQEYFDTVTRKLHLDPDLAKRKVTVFAKFYVVEPTTSDVLAAIDLHRLHKISFWDAMIVHCAKQAGCREVLSEDMHTGEVIDGVRIVNPFV